MNRINTSPVRKALSLVALSGLAALSQVFVAPALAGPTSPTNPTTNANNEYLAHWAVTTWTSKTKGVDLQAQINLNGTSILRDAVIFYESSFGNFPYAGPHIADNPAYMTAHLAKLGKDIAAKIPDPNFSGYVCIDYETWQPNWSRTPNVKSSGALDARDFDFKDDWEEYLLKNKPQVLKGLTGAARDKALEATYNQACQKFYLDTLREAKRLRPKAKWGFYGYPYGEYYSFLPAYKSKWQSVNDNEMGWLFDAVDVLYPHIYAVMVTVEDRAPAPKAQENTPAQNAQYILDNVTEAVRVSRKKPVLPFVYFRYHPNVGKAMEGKWVTDLVVRQMVELPKQAGAKGIMIWDCIESDQQFTELNRLVQAQVTPRMDMIAVIPTTAPNTALASSGSSPKSPTAGLASKVSAPLVVKPSAVASVPGQ